MKRAPASEYRIAIPSCRRAAVLRDRSLAFLWRHGISPSRITVFLDSHDEELPQYQQLASEHGFRLQVSPVRGINAQRRVMADFYPEGSAVVQLDDDVTDLVYASDPKTLQPVEDLHRFIVEAFDQLRGYDLYVWGVGAVANPYFMYGRKPSHDLKFLIATLWGYVSRPGHAVHDTRCPVKEDYELSLRAWWFDGGLLRFNDVAVKADHYKTPGGCQDTRTLEVSERATRILLEDWPGLVRRNEKRKSGHAEVLLARKKRHSGHPVTEAPPGFTRHA